MDRRLGDVHFDDIVAARRLLSRMLTPTPLVTHPLLSKRIGAEVHVKLENAVPLGSFKLRGGLNYVANLTSEQCKRGLVTATRGNHGQSLASAAQRHRVACAVFVPAGNNPDKNAAIAALGANVTIAGHDFDAAWQAAQEYASARAPLPCIPRVSRSSSQAMPRWRWRCWIRRRSRSTRCSCRWAAAASPPAWVSFSRHCHRIPGLSACSPRPRRRSRARGTRAKCARCRLAKPSQMVSQRGSLRRTRSQILREVLDDVIEVSEAEIAGAIRCLAETLHQLAEGAGAAALAGALHLHRRLTRQRVGVVLSGGNITSSQSAEDSSRRGARRRHAARSSPRHSRTWNTARVRPA